MAHPVSGDVVDDAVSRRILTRENRSPVGRAERDRVKGAREHRPFAGQPIDVGRFEEGVPRHAHLVEAHVVHDDDDDVRAVFPGHGVGLVARGRDTAFRSAGYEGEPQEDQRSW